LFILMYCFPSWSATVIGAVMPAPKKMDSMPTTSAAGNTAENARLLLVSQTPGVGELRVTNIKAVLSESGTSTRP
jgi:hypothetical protein